VLLAEYEVIGNASIFGMISLPEMAEPHKLTDLRGSARRKPNEPRALARAVLRTVMNDPSPLDRRAD
jgi:hypothetical protein